MALSVSRHQTRWHAVILLLAGFNLFWRLGQPGLTNADEAHYGVSAYEMLRDGTWFTSTYGGQPDYWNLKPPLGFWSIALSFRIFGCSPFALRLPSALGEFLTVALITRFTSRRIGRLASVVAGLLLATQYTYINLHTGRTGELDGMLTVPMTAAGIVAAQIPGRPRLMMVASILLTAAFLLKSFAVLPAAAAIIAFIAISGAWRMLSAPLVGWSLAVALGPIAAWAIARVHADDSSIFLLRMVQEDALMRYSSNIDQIHYAPMGFAGALFNRFHAGVVIPMLAWLSAPRRWPGAAWWTSLDRRAVLIALLIGVPLVIFSCASTRHRHYINPIRPWIAVAAGWSFAVTIVRRRPWVGALATMLLVISIAVGERCLVTDIVRGCAHPLQDELDELSIRLRGRRVAVVRSDGNSVELFVLEALHHLDVALVDPEQWRQHPDGRLLLIAKDDTWPSGVVVILSSQSYGVVASADSLPTSTTGIRAF